ncbi:MAG TPA: protease inhibitor I42 family protein [Burkholderiales bacterium]|jgi:predicted secreted protein
MRVVTTLIVAGAIAGCAGSGSSPTSDSANLLGTYTGLLPCADCAGLRTDLRLYSAQHGGDVSRYEMRETYIGTRDGDRTAERSGRAKLVHGSASDKEASVYQLDAEHGGARLYFLRAGENELRLLDRDKREIPASIPRSLYRAVALAESDSGKAIEVSPGERVIVRLPSNRTTGYRWSLLTSGAESLTRLAAGEYSQDVGADGKAGAGGTESWYFQAAASGEEELRFEYRRPWEEHVPAAKSANYTVKVR